MNTLHPDVSRIFQWNRLVGHYTYVRPGEVVPHFFSRGSYFLTRDGDNLVAHGNSCLHRGTKLVIERKRLQVGELVTCPLHRWTYQPLTGSLEETPSYARLPRSCPRQLESVDLAEIGKSGFYFEHKPNYLEAYFLYLTQLRISTRDFEFDSEQVTFYHVSWETIADCYLDKHRHKFEKYGFSQYVNPEAATTYGGQSYLITEYPLRPAGTDLSGTIGWSKLHEEVMKLNWQPTWGSLHTLIFPGLMIEFYPHVMVINQIVPQSDKLTAVYHQVYFERSALENYDLQNAFSEAYSEKAQNDSVVYDLYEDGRLNSRFFIPPTRNEDRHLGAVEGLHDWLGHDYKKS